MLTSKEKTAIAVYFAQQTPNPTEVKRLTRHLPNQVDKWGKIRIIGESECVQSVYGQNSAGENCRDASFARVSPINLRSLVLILNRISSFSSWMNMKMIQDGLQGTSASLDMDKYNLHTYYTAGQSKPRFHQGHDRDSCCRVSMSNDRGGRNPRASMVWKRRYGTDKGVQCKSH